MKPLAVLGIGNVLMGDDGLGPHVIKLLEAAWEPDERLRLIDAGTPGLDLTAYLAELDAVIVVDAVKAEGAPGEVRLYGKAELVERPPLLSLSPHEPGLREAILNAEFLGVAPGAIRLVGVLSARVDFGPGLSPPVRAALPEIVARVRAELVSLGFAPRDRAAPPLPDVWWERRP